MFTVTQYYLIIVQLDLKDSSHNYTRGYGMSFISYPHLILLISRQTFKITAGPNFFWNLNIALGWKLQHSNRAPHPRDRVVSCLNEVLMTQFNYFLSKLIFLICGLRPSQPSNPIEILFFIGLNFFSSIIMLLILGFISLHLSRPGVSLSKIELASI